MDNIRVQIDTLLSSKKAFDKIAVEVLEEVGRSGEGVFVKLPLDQALALAQVAATLHLARVTEEQ